MVALRKDGRTHDNGRSPARPADGPLQFVRRDTLPDYVDYRDTGCELAPSCLRCPLSRCKYDEPGGYPRLVMEARDREIALLRARHRAPIDMLADTYGLSRRSIFRILREHRRATPPEGGAATDA